MYMSVGIGRQNSVLEKRRLHSLISGNMYKTETRHLYWILTGPSFAVSEWGLLYCSGSFIFCVFPVLCLCKFSVFPTGQEGGRAHGLALLS
jgi:hypothetical protein